MAILKRGLLGEPVRILQQKLGVTADGIFGSRTEAALLAYQRSHGLHADGIAGPDTFSQMQLHELVQLHRGQHGETVKKLQRGLGLTADGAFGPGTEAAVKRFQTEHGQAPDGIAHPATLALIPGFEIPSEKVAASKVTVETQPVAVEAVEQAKATGLGTAVAQTNTPAPAAAHPHGVVETVTHALHSAEDKVLHVGQSIWSTVRRIF